MMAAIADRLRDRWDGITPRERRLVLLLAASFGVVIFFSVVIAIRDGLADIAAKNETMRKALRALEVYRATAAEREAAGPRVDFGTSPINLEQHLDRIAKSVGVRIPGYSAISETQKGQYTEASLHIEVLGLSILELKGFLERIEADSNKVAITNLRIKRNFRDKDKLDVNLTVATYYESSDKENGEKR